MPDTGSLRGDLRAIFSQLCHHAGETPMGHVLPQMIAASRMNPEMRVVVQSSSSPSAAARRGPCWSGPSPRGELPADTDFDLLSDLLAGPFFYRILVTDAPVDDQLVDAVLDVVLAGAGAEKARRRLSRRGETAPSWTSRPAGPPTTTSPRSAIADGRAFGMPYTDQDIEDRRLILDLSRFLLAVDGSEIVGITGDYRCR